MQELNDAKKVWCQIGFKRSARIIHRCLWTPLYSFSDHSLSSNCVLGNETGSVNDPKTLSLILSRHEFAITKKTATETDHFSGNSMETKRWPFDWVGLLLDFGLLWDRSRTIWEESCILPYQKHRPCLARHSRVVSWLSGEPEAALCLSCHCVPCVNGVRNLLHERQQKVYDCINIGF